MRESFGSERREIEEEKEREGERVQDFENEIRYILRERGIKSIRERERERAKERENQQQRKTPIEKERVRN